MTSAAPARTAMERRAVPTPGSTMATHDPGGQVRPRPFQGQASRPDILGRHFVGQVDDGHEREPGPQHAVKGADEAVRQPVVGEQADDPGRAATLKAARYPADLLSGRGVLGFKEPVHVLFPYPVRAPDSYRRQLPGLHQAVDRHVGHPELAATSATVT